MAEMTIRPKIKGTLILRFEDGTEAVIGEITYEPTLDVKLETPDGTFATYAHRAGL